jgi:hypothetical protein
LALSTLSVLQLGPFHSVLADQRVMLRMRREFASLGRGDAMLEASEHAVLTWINDNPPRASLLLNRVSLVWEGGRLG